MVKWLKNILALVIIAFLVWYLEKHWEQLKVLLELSFAKLGLMYGVTFVVAFLSSVVLRCLVGALGTKTKGWEMFELQNAALLLNYAPMKMGTVFRANFLKNHYGFAYSSFATFFLYMSFLMTFTAAAVGALALVVFYGVSGYQNQMLLLVFVLVVFGSLGFLFLPLPMPKGQGKLLRKLSDFLGGRSRLAKQKKAIWASILLMVVNTALTALRMGVIYESLGQECKPAGFLILGGLGYSILFIALTPGSLGVREFVLGAAAIVIGVPLEVGILAAVIDRMVTLSYAFTIGGVCAVRLWLKSPDDFKSEKE